MLVHYRGGRDWPVNTKCPGVVLTAYMQARLPDQSAESVLSDWTWLPSVRQLRYRIANTAHSSLDTRTFPQSPEAPIRRDR